MHNFIFVILAALFGGHACLSQERTLRSLPLTGKLRSDIIWAASAHHDLRVRDLSPGQLQQSKKYNVAVLDFDARAGVSKEEAASLSDIFSTQLVKSGEFVVIDRNRTKDILQEQGFQQSEACSKIECIVEVGKILKVQKMFSGTIGKIGRVFNVAIQLVDVETAEIEFVEEEQHEGDIEGLVYTVVPTIASRMIARIVGKETKSEVIVPMSGERRSSLEAGLYSAIFPGAGQLYNESYFESAGFIGAEIGLWVVYAINNAKADKQTDDFQSFADIHWSVVQYAEWMKQYFPAEASAIAVDPNTSLPPWERVDWNVLNDSEDKIAQRPTTTGFTHRLPRRPEQQYYELIGKYPQYGGGWDDAPNFTPPDILQKNLSSRFLLYSQMRGEANDLYRIAATASYFILANHILSAVEAAWGAARFNSRLTAEVHLLPRQWGAEIVEFVPTAKIRIEF